MKLLAILAALGLCGGDRERILDLCPEHLMDILAEHHRQRAEDRLALLAAVNRGMAGGDAYDSLARQLSSAASP